MFGRVHQNAVLGWNLPSTIDLFFFCEHSTFRDQPETYSWHACTHTHTQRSFYDPLDFVWDYPGEPVPEPIWILLKQETLSSSGISWAICKSAQMDNHASTPSASFLRAGCPSYHSTIGIKAALKAGTLRKKLPARAWLTIPEQTTLTVDIIIHDISHWMSMFFIKSDWLLCEAMPCTFYSTSLSLVSSQNSPTPAKTAPNTSSQDSCSALALIY